MTQTSETRPRRRPAIRRLSASAINRYRTCPRQFHFQDVLRAPRGEEEVSENLIVGNAAHNALRKFHGLAEDERSEATLHQCLRAVWRGVAPVGTFDFIEDERDCGRRCLEILSTYAGAFDLTVTPLAREKWVAARLDCGMRVFGKVDRLDLAADKRTIEVIDYKTAARNHLQPEDLPDDTAAKAYVAATEAETGHEVSRVRFMYIAQGHEVIWEVEREDADAARRWLDEHVRELLDNDQYEPRPGRHCGWCPYNLACDAVDRQALGDVEKEIPDDIAF